MFLMAVSGSCTQWEVMNNDLCPRFPVAVFPRSPVSQHLDTYSYALGRVLGNIREGDQQITKSEAPFSHYCFSALKNFSQKNPQICALLFSHFFLFCMVQAILLQDSVCIVFLTALQSKINMQYICVYIYRERETI